jgi:tetratricopeptide (TPR) repeat protein
MKVRLFLLAVGLSVLVFPVLNHTDFIKGASYFAQGKYEEAVREYEEELKADPNYVQGHYIVGLCYARLKNYDKAIESLKKALSLDEKNFQISLALAQAYFDAQKYPELKAALATATQNASEASDLQKLRSLQTAALFNQQDYARALPELRAAVDSNPRNAALQAQLGIANYHLQKYDDAIAALKAATTLNPEDLQAALFLGQSYLARAASQTDVREKNKGYTEALHLAQKWADKPPQSVEALLLAGHSALALKRYAEAVSFLKRAAVLQPDSPALQFDLGQAYAFNGQLPEAETALTQASRTLAQEPSLFSILGFVLEKQNKLVEAEAAYRQANALTPSKDLQTAIDRVRQKLSHPHP